MERVVSSVRSQTCGTKRRKNIQRERKRKRRDSKIDGNKELHRTR